MSKLEATFQYKTTTVDVEAIEGDESNTFRVRVFSDRDGAVLATRVTKLTDALTEVNLSLETNTAQYMGLLKVARLAIEPSATPRPIMFAGSPLETREGGTGDE